MDFIESDNKMILHVNNGSRRFSELVLPNDGDGTFLMHTVASEKNSSYIFVSDIDNDGKIDILNGAVWYKNIGG